MRFPTSRYCYSHLAAGYTRGRVGARDDAEGRHGWVGQERKREKSGRPLPSRRPLSPHLKPVGIFYHSGSSASIAQPNHFRG